MCVYAYKYISYKGILINLDLKTLYISDKNNLASRRLLSEA